jgi:hypothetical protein
MALSPFSETITPPTPYNAQQTHHADGDAHDASGKPCRPTHHDAPRPDHLDFQGAERRRLHPDDLLARFEEVRRAEQLDESAAKMLTEQYV